MSKEVDYQVQLRYTQINTERIQHRILNILDRSANWKRNSSLTVSRWKRTNRGKKIQQRNNQSNWGTRRESDPDAQCFKEFLSGHASLLISLTTVVRSRREKRPKRARARIEIRVSLLCGTSKVVRRLCPPTSAVRLPFVPG